MLVADDSARVRRALATLLATRADVRVVGLARDGAEAVRMAAALAPDVVLMDVSMPVLDGIEATRQITRHSPGARIVILTAFRERHQDAFEAGATAHLLKDADPEDLLSCVRAAAARDEPLSS